MAAYSVVSAGNKYDYHVYEEGPSEEHYEWNLQLIKEFDSPFG